MVRLLFALFLVTACARPATVVPEATGAPPPPRPRPAPLAAGQPAPDFSLYDSIGDLHDLAALRANGPVVVFFIQGAWCGRCRQLLARVQLRLAAFGEAGASVVAVTQDGGDRARRLAEAVGLAFPLLVDPDRKVARDFGVATASGFSVPAVFVVNDAGVVAWSQEGDSVSEDVVLSEVRNLTRPEDQEPAPDDSDAAPDPDSEPDSDEPEPDPPPEELPTRPESDIPVPGAPPAQE